MMIARCVGPAMVLALASATSGQWWWPPTGGLSVGPECRDPSITISLKVSGQWPDSCIPTGAEAIVNGFEVDLAIRRDIPPGICLSVITPWSQEQPVTGLAPGIYQVYASHTWGGQVVHPRTLVGSFNVVASCGTVCYPNCDSSSVAPVLNIADFICFISQFAAQNPYANCDGSTTPPVLNVTDFICFINLFGAGCG